MRKFHSDYLLMEEKGGITFLTFKAEVIDLELAKEIDLQRKKFTEEKHGNILLFVDGTRVKVVDNKARAYFGSNASGNDVKAIAFYTNSVFSAFLANFLLKVHLQDLHIPKKIFTNKNKALLWLKSITTISMILFRIC